MTKAELWKIFCNRNPVFREPDARISISVRGLEKLFSQTWDIGWEAGRVASKRAAQLEAMFEDMMQ